MGPKGGGGLGIKMRGAMHIGTIAIVVIMLCASHSGSAHEIKQEQYSHEELVSDVNALGTRFSPNSISNTDVIFVSSVTCAAMRTAIRENLPERIGLLLRKRYPSVEEIKNIDTMDFITYEQEAFSNLGTDKQALDLVYWSIQEDPFIPPIAPPEDGALIKSMTAIEGISCALRAAQLGPPTEPAASEMAFLTRALVNAVVGLAVMVVDAKIAVDTVGLASIVLGMASGGWGWNRIEEAASEALEIGQAWVR
jgi:hypothetical protein